jgi:hypothetical protein
VQEVIRETGALDELETFITRLTDEAIAAVQMPMRQLTRRTRSVISRRGGKSCLAARSSILLKSRVSSRMAA